MITGRILAFVLGQSGRNNSHPSEESRTVRKLTL
jgi:hypothetical protein